PFFSFYLAAMQTFCVLGSGPIKANSVERQKLDFDALRSERRLRAQNGLDPKESLAINFCAFDCQNLVY
ncbi:MAG: hypothetical protein ABJH20_03655, partial [Rhizobiaceae bacterium]